MSHITWLLLVKNGRLKKLLRLFGLRIVELILEERDANQPLNRGDSR